MRLMLFALLLFALAAALLTFSGCSVANYGTISRNAEPGVLLQDRDR